VAGNGLAGSTKNASTSASNGRAGLIGNDIGTGSFNSGVHGLSVNGTGVSGLSTNGNGVTGQSTLSAGVFGTSSGTGVYGAAPAGVGVSGNTSNGFGVRGNAGTGGTGVYGTSPNGVGVTAVGGSNNALSGDHIYPALSIVNNGTEGDYIDACPAGQNPCDQGGNFTVDRNGDESTTGFISVINNSISVSGTGGYFYNGVCVIGCVSSASIARRVRTYSPQSTQPMVEDNGEAQLINGAAYVRVDPAFANVIDQRTVYSVSITPEGNSNGLFVTQKTLNGFAIRENNGGKSTLAFEYRIVAKPFGSTARRLPMVDIPLRRTLGARSSHPGDLVPVH